MTRFCIEKKPLKNPHTKLMTLCYVKQASHKWTSTVKSRSREVIRVGKSIKTEGGTVITRPQGQRKAGNYCLMGTEFLFRMIKDVGSR